MVSSLSSDKKQNETKKVSLKEYSKQLVYTLRNDKSLLYKHMDKNSIVTKFYP